MNGTLLLIVTSITWGVAHSILASHSAKNAAARLFGQIATNRLYRFSYNLFSIASFFPVLVLLLRLPDQPLYSIPPLWSYLTTVVQGLAAIALIAGVMQTGPWEFIGLQQLLSTGQPEASQLTTDGLYGYVRHPLYTAGLVFIWLTPQMSINRLALWIIMSLYLVIGAYFEERKLLNEFGQPYADYKAKTPMLIPRFSRQ